MHSIKTSKISNVIAILDLEPCHSEITLVDNGNIIFIRSLDFVIQRQFKIKLNHSNMILKSFLRVSKPFNRIIKMYKILFFT